MRTGNNVVRLYPMADDELAPIRHALYGVFIALTSALAPEKADLAFEILASFVDMPDTSPSEAQIYRSVVGAHEETRKYSPETDCEDFAIETAH